MNQKRKSLLFYIIISLVAVTILIITIILLICKNTDFRSTPNIVDQIDKYISKGNSKVYYTENIPQEDVDALVDYFDSIDYFKDHVYMKLDKTNSNEYFVYLIVSEYTFTSETRLSFFQNLANNMSLHVFHPNSVIVINLCDNKFETIKAIKSIWPETN